MLPQFAVVAGGQQLPGRSGLAATARVKRKFEYLQERFGGDSFCVGCGRCGRQCTSGIDIYGHRAGCRQGRCPREVHDHDHTQDAAMSLFVPQFGVVREAREMTFRRGYYGWSSSGPCAISPGSS